MALARAAYRLHVAGNCIYGVDRNPLAVDLAKTSLWLATAALNVQTSRTVGRPTHSQRAAVPGLTSICQRWAIGPCHGETFGHGR